MAIQKKAPKTTPTPDTADSLNRRRFIAHSAAGVTAATALSAATKSQAANANERIRIGFIGPGGRGLGLT